MSQNNQTGNDEHFIFNGDFTETACNVLIFPIYLHLEKIYPKEAGELIALYLYYLKKLIQQRRLYHSEIPMEQYGVKASIRQTAKETHKRPTIIRELNKMLHNAHAITATYKKRKIGGAVTVIKMHFNSLLFQRACNNFMGISEHNTDVDTVTDLSNTDVDTVTDLSNTDVASIGSNDTQPLVPNGTSDTHKPLVPGGTSAVVPKGTGISEAVKYNNQIRACAHARGSNSASLASFSGEDFSLLEDNNISSTRQNLPSSNKTKKYYRPEEDHVFVLSMRLLPKSFQESSIFQKTWSEWFTYRKTEKKTPVTKTSMLRQVTLLKEHSVEQATEIINTSIMSGWKGLFEKKFYNNKPNNESSMIRSDGLKWFTDDLGKNEFMLPVSNGWEGDGWYVYKHPKVIGTDQYIEILKGKEAQKRRSRCNVLVVWRLSKFTKEKESVDFNVFVDEKKRVVYDGNTKKCGIIFGV